LFAREMNSARAEVQRMQGQLDTAVAEFNRSSVTMTPAAKATRQQQLQQMEERNRQRAADLDQQMQQRESELTAPIMTRVNAIIDGIRAEYNYSFIFDVAAQPSTIVAADRTLDITQLVIQRVQAAGPAPAPAGATQAAPGGPPIAGDSSRPATPPAPPAGPRLRPRP
ncbi:MAG TPA: OmpH family outer membrane protein, partial [Gemmatimonadales bacterium]